MTEILESKFIKKVTINCKELYLFKVYIGNQHCEFFVEYFKKGIANIFPFHNTLIFPLLKAIEYCFDDNSNFNEQLNLAFGCEDNLECIIFRFNFVTMEATKNNCNFHALLEKYNSIMNQYPHRWNVERAV